LPGENDITLKILQFYTLKSEHVYSTLSNTMR